MMNLPKPAQYLLRIDDLCPTVHAQRWRRLRTLLEEFNVRPILAIVPANADRDLDASPTAPGFWRDMRAMQAAGAATALHGLTHVCSVRGRSLIPLHTSSEFAGATLDLQGERIARGLSIMRDHGLAPKLFVAPRHGFDRNTLLALREQGIGFISDGFARVPLVRFGVIWIPMQLWSPAPRKQGLWTICIHPNTTDDARFKELRSFLVRYAGQFTSFDRIVAESGPAHLGIFERSYELIATARLRLRHMRSRRAQKQSFRAAAGCLPTGADVDSPPAVRNRALPSGPAQKTS
jgi:predicted deacetylase